jgi:YfiH family protein
LKAEFKEGIYRIYFENVNIFFTTKNWNGFLPFNSKIYSLNQIHSNKIIEIKENDDVLEKEGDGLFTRLKNISLEVKTADCFPVFIFNEEIIMVLHVGWRGAKEGIVQKGIEIFEKYNLKNVKAFLGPGIKKCCYEIKEDVAKFFEDFLEERDNKIYFDLEKFIIDKFIKKEFDFKNIFSFPFCTSCKNDLFYSNRKGDKGRIRSWIIKK